MSTRGRFLSVAMLASLAAGGCEAPPAVLELMAQAQKALAQAAQEELQRQEQAMAAVQAKVGEMDRAFDADVMLVAAGGVRDEDGSPVQLTPQWVISARKGYSAARSILDEQARRAQVEHQVRHDNLQAGQEAMEMAAQLVAEQYALSRQVRQHILNMQRKWIND